MLNINRKESVGEKQAFCWQEWNALWIISSYIGNDGVEMCIAGFSQDI